MFQVMEWQIPFQIFLDDIRDQPFPAHSSNVKHVPIISHSSSNEVKFLSNTTHTPLPLSS